MRHQGTNQGNTEKTLISVVTNSSSPISETNLNSEAVNLKSIKEFINFSIPAQIAYHELADVPVRDIDAFEQLERNLNLLQGLQLRMSFMMREIRYQMKL